MNAKVVIILLIVFGLCITALLLPFGDLFSSVIDTTSPQERTTVLGPSAEPFVLTKKQISNDLQRITFNNEQAETTLQLERIEGRWWVTEPSRYPANSSAVDELLATLGSTRGMPTDQEDGLTTESSNLVLTYPERETKLWFNRRLGAGRAAITCDEDGKLQSYNAQDTLHDLYDSLDPAVFYAMKINPPLMPEIERIEIAMPEGTSQLTQNEGNLWVIGEGLHAERALELPLDGHAGLSDYFKLISDIKLVEPQHYEAMTELAQFGLNKPVIHVRFIPFNRSADSYKKGVEIRVGVPADPQDSRRYVSIGTIDEELPAVFTAESRSVLLLGQPATTFRDPRIVSVPSTMIERIETKRPPAEGQPLTEQFLFFTPNQPPQFMKDDATVVNADRAAASSLLANLTTPSGAQYLEGLETDLEKLRVVVIKGRLGWTESFGVFVDPETSQESPSVLIRRGLEPVMLRVLKSKVEPLLSPQQLIADE